MHRLLPSISYLLVFFTSLVLHEMDRSLVWLMFIVALYAVLEKLGKGVALRESIVLMYILTSLVMPILGYDFYNYSFYQAKQLGYIMRVPDVVYFSYVIPCVSAFSFALTFPMPKDGVSDEGAGVRKVLQRASLILEERRTLGIEIMFVGLVAFVFNDLLPLSLQYITTILFMACFAGILYIYLTPNRSNKTMVMLSFILFIVLQSLSTGMFTIVIYMGITISSFFLIGVSMSIWKKLSLLALSVFIILVLQTTKGNFRYIILNQGTDNKVALFARLFVENLSKSSTLIEPKQFWSIYLRTNQGLIISSVMSRFPTLKPFDNGAVLSQTVLASFIPRLIWPNKPTADGRFNMKYYAGKIVDRFTSMNVGPIAEGYGSFGKMGGITFMFLLGVFVRWIYGRVFAIARQTPLIILWIPVMFYQITYSAETDTMQILNSIIKISILMSFIYLVSPRWFGKKRVKAAARHAALGWR